MKARTTQSKMAISLPSVLMYESTGVMGIMEINLKELKRKVMRSVVEFNMIEPGDLILIGLSGGKDSLFLLYIMKEIAGEIPFPLRIEALSVDLGFSKAWSEEARRLKEYCHNMGVEHHFIQTHIAEHIDEENPCATCAYFRRAVMARFAKENGFTKIALGHHLDDAVETFLLNLFFIGQLKVMSPVIHLHRTGVDLIRPLIYLRESQVEEGFSLLGLEPLPSACPFSDKTQRNQVKEFLRRNDDFFPNIARGMRMRDGEMKLWPPEPSREDIWKLFKAFWNKGG